MSVCFDTFLDWAKDRFGEENLKLRNTSHGTEICANSHFALRKLGKDDVKHHLWMNPSGGKSKHPEKGSFRCWLTDEQGSLVHLVSQVDCISHDEAEELICGVVSLRALEKRVDEFFGFQEETEIVLPAEVKTLELPDYSFLIDGMAPTHFMRLKARQYLNARKLSSEGLYVCTGGDYKDRIIIPYRDHYGDLIFYNGRLMHDKADSLRYMKCKGVSEEDVLFMTQWPRAGSKVYVMEGEFDAMSVQVAGFPACAVGGKSISDTQIEMLRQYQLALAFDADAVGLKSMLDVGTALLEKGIANLRYVRPPKMYKDWNKLLVQKNAATLRAYIEKFEKPFTRDTPAMLLAKRL